MSATAPAAPDTRPSGLRLLPPPLVPVPARPEVATVDLLAGMAAIAVGELQGAMGDLGRLRGRVRYERGAFLAGQDVSAGLVEASHAATDAARACRLLAEALLVEARSLV